ncbi:MAG: WecB/TagA/CpsF family glycosyltransferase, partial [Pseudomonadota bacterium]|nr:WecB/TagA/CpsF family glycosyltransferase [Pseudomonadota bacterium]
RLLRHPHARGIGLCVGASLEFLVGTKRRAPRWMRSLGLEWLHRMLSDPRRLWRRYCYGVVPLLALFSREIAQRAHHAR